MRNYWWCVFLFRIILPLTLATAGFIRPTITSYIYMIMGCYMPFFSVPTPTTMKQATGTYMKILLTTCILISSMVLTFYFALFFFSEYESELELCSPLEIAIRTLGVVNFGSLNSTNAVMWCLPEPLMLVVTIVNYFAFKRMCQDTEVVRATAKMRDKGEEDMDEINRKKMVRMMLNIGKYLVVFLFCLTAVLKASVFGGIYYLVFLTVMTYWACNKQLGKVYARFLIILVPIIFVNITIMFFYQFQYFQDSYIIDTDSLWGRLFNLLDINTYKDCIDPRIFVFHAKSNSTYAVPICLYFLYYLIVLVSRELLQAKDGFFNLFTTFCRKSATIPIAKERWFKASEKIKKQVTANSTMTDKIEFLLEQLLQLIINISYLTANFIMMVWGIAYVGWKAMILLLWANLIWLLPFRKKVMLISSPFLVVWVWFLLVTNYLYCMDLTEEELPYTYGIVDFKSGIISEGNHVWIHLLTKSLFGVIIFVTMRQLFQERAYKKQRKQLADAMGLTEEEAGETLASSQRQNEFLSRLQQVCFYILATWWIWVVVITMIWMEFWGRSNIFRIAFVGLAILFLTTFQLCPFPLWKKFLKFYWWIIIIYAMFNLFVVYMYQIEATRNLFFKFLSEEIFQANGFYVWQDRKKLFAALANPIFFQIAVVVQKNYLQSEFDKITSPRPPPEIKPETEETSKWEKFHTRFTNAKNVMFEFLELHMQKIILLVGWFMCIFDLCALFFPFVLLFTASCVFGGIFVNIVVYLVSCLVQILIVLRLIYMNMYSKHDEWNYIGEYERNGESFNKTLNTADWIGFHQSAKGLSYADFWQLDWCFLYVFTVTVMRIVTIRMDNYRRPRNLETPNLKTLVMFPDINYINCHEKASSFMKFLVNYGFYKFGVEITLFFATVVMTMRMDIVAIVLSIFLLIIFALNRNAMRIIWLPALIATAIAVPVQYLVTLGYWPTYWNSTLTRYWTSEDQRIRVQEFCYFLNMAFPPDKRKITLDFWYLLFLSRQWHCFEIEKKTRGQYHPAGSNDDVSDLIDVDAVENPVPDYITYTRISPGEIKLHLYEEEHNNLRNPDLRLNEIMALSNREAKMTLIISLRGSATPIGSSLDVIKRIFFITWFYAALMSTLLAGIMRPTLYSIGYLMVAFLFIWEGTDIFLRPPKDILRRWNILIGYNIVVMIIRTISQIFGCILIYDSRLSFICMLIKVFSIGCVDKYGMTANVPNIVSETHCKSIYSSLGLAFDCICFFFLIIQQRIFKSYHFFHMVNNIKAQTILSDRGAELITEQRSKKRKLLDLEVATIRDNIQKKLDSVRAAHRRVQGDVYVRRKANQPYILKSNDYYMFDDAILKNDIPLKPETNIQNVLKSAPYDPMPLIEYFKLFHYADVATVLEERDLRARQKRALQEGKNPDDIRKAELAKPGPSTKKELTKTRKFLNIFIFIWGTFESLIVSITLFFNKLSKDFSEILYTINIEKQILKEHTKYAQGVRLGSNQIWTPVQNYRDEIFARKDNTVDQSYLKQNIYFKFVNATWNLLLSHTELLSYFIIILNQYKRANFISLPLVILVFCWGGLTIPKPTKTFWVVTISYVLIMLFIKNFFVMDIIPWEASTHVTNLFFPPLIIGLNRYTSVRINVSVLVVLFFHRIVLQMLGLWKPNMYRTVTLIDNGEYVLKDMKLAALPAKDTTTKNPFVVESVEASLGDYFPNSIVHGLFPCTFGEENIKPFILIYRDGNIGNYSVPNEHLSIGCRRRFRKYGEGIRLFMQQIIIPSSTQIPVDVYTPMFLCDLINLLLLIFFYGSFWTVESDEGFVDFIQNNNVPISFIIVVLIYFFSMVIDRAIYLRKSLLKKLVYHFFQVIAVHIYFFILYPIITERTFINTPVVQVFYVFKCLYFLFSTYQIKNGYPALISSHYLWHNTGPLQRLGYKIYTIIPYFFVMRTLLDWICTDSCLSVSDWFTMEDISQNVYENMCQRKTNSPNNKPRKRTQKYLLGGFLYILLVCTLIFPFLLFSLGSTVGVATHPTKFKIEVYMGSAEPIFQSYTSEKKVQRLTQDNYINLTTTFNNIKESEAIFGNFWAEDVVVVKWSPHSLTQWKVSPGTHRELMKDLQSNKTIRSRVEIHYIHNGHGGEKTQGSFGQNTDIPPLPNKQRQNLLDIMTHKNESTILRLPLVFPKFLLITKDAKSKPLSIIKEPPSAAYSPAENRTPIEGRKTFGDKYWIPKSFDQDSDEEDIVPNPSLFRNLLVSIKTGKNKEEWWHVQEECKISDDDYFYYLKDIQHNSCDELVMFTYNEKVFSKAISYITQSGIIGLYLLYFMIMVDFLVGCRVTVDEIWIDDLPGPEGLWRKCKEVYIARDMHNYELEEELFAQLIFIMRSREVLIKLTREPDSAYNPPILTGETKKTK